MMMKEMSPADRLAGLRRFAIAITVLNILGHTVFGFEQAWIQPFVGIGSAYLCELVLELIDCYTQKRKPRFAGGWRKMVDFFLSAHITGLAVAMLLYANTRLLPIAFAAAVAITSKTLFRVACPNGTRHFLNPSNFGITATLLLFAWVGIAPPYHFTENIHGWGGWILPVAIVCTGSLLNTFVTKRILVALGWILGFFVQAVFRNLVFDMPLTLTLLPMTGVAFVLFTFYMVTDPATTPGTRPRQFLFGAAVAAVYGLLVMSHIVFGFFFSLTLVSFTRGASIYVNNLMKQPVVRKLPAQAPIASAKEMAG